MLGSLGWGQGSTAVAWTSWAGHDRCAELAGKRLIWRHTVTNPRRVQDRIICVWSAIDIGRKDSTASIKKLHEIPLYIRNTEIHRHALIALENISEFIDDGVRGGGVDSGGLRI